MICHAEPLAKHLTIDTQILPILRSTTTKDERFTQNDSLLLISYRLLGRK